MISAASGALAQQVHYSDAPTLACLAAAATPDQSRACIGTAANSCMAATSDGSTTIGMMDCLGAEQAFWDARLNAAYADLRTRARAADADLDQVGSSAPRMEPALKAMQRAWIPYRDATCAFEQSLWGGGSGGGPAVIGCLLQVTGEQALYLEGSWLAD